MASTSYPITALYLGKSLNLAEIEKKNDLALLARRRNSLLFQPTSDRMAIVFSYGVVVLFNFDPKLSHKYVKQVAKYGEDVLDTPKTEDYTIVVDPDQKMSVEFNSVILNKIDPDKIHIIAEVLAQSVAIEYVEERAIQFVANFEKIHTALEKTGRINISDKEVHKMIGAGRNVVQYVITQLSLLDKPDATWEDKEMEQLFIAMRKMFELDDRFQALQFRLNFINDSSEIILGILQHRRGTRMEIIVIWLIIGEIIIMTAEWFIKWP